MQLHPVLPPSFLNKGKNRAQRERERESLRGKDKTEDREGEGEALRRSIKDQQRPLRAEREQPGFKQHLGGRYTWVISREQTSPRDRTSKT